MMLQTLHFETAYVGRRVLVYDETDSTNDRAAELAADPGNAGVVVLARSQTAGRGQYGRSWHSPPDQSALLSVLLFPPQELRRPAVLTAWAAVAVGEAILRLTGLQARIKWPNDLLLGGKKVCGILTECRVQSAECRVENPTQHSALSTQHCPVVAGIGLNVNQTPPDFERTGLLSATSLAMEAGKPFELRAVVGELIGGLDAEYARLLEGNLATLEACWKWRVGLLGKHVIAECADGSTVSGRLREMSFAGVELVQPNGSRRVLPPEIVRHLVGGEGK